MKDRWLEVLKYSLSAKEIVDVLYEISESDDELLSLLATFSVVKFLDYGEPERERLVKKWWQFWK